MSLHPDPHSAFHCLAPHEVCPDPVLTGCYVRYSAGSVTGYVAAPGFDLEPVLATLRAESRVVIDAKTPTALNEWLAVQEATAAVVGECCAAMAAAAPRSSMAEEQRLAFARETMRGSALLALHARPLHFASLKDSVAAPGGMTIRGLQALRLNGFQGLVMREVVDYRRRVK